MLWTPPRKISINYFPLKLYCNGKKNDNFFSLDFRTPFLTNIFSQMEEKIKRIQTNTTQITISSGLMKNLILKINKLHCQLIEICLIKSRVHKMLYPSSDQDSTPIQPYFLALCNSCLKMYKTWGITDKRLNESS